jgi:hypothetical protein
VHDSADSMAMGDLDFFGRQKDRHIGPEAGVEEAGAEEAGVWELVLHALLFSFSLGRVLVPSVHNTHGTREYLKTDMLKVGQQRKSAQLRESLTTDSLPSLF